MTLEYFINSCKNYKLTNFTKVIFFDIKNNIVYFYDKNQFIHKMNCCNIYKNQKYSIRSAINKTEYFINKAKEIHGDRYDYSLVNYIKHDNKITIICPIHGIFSQTPNAHLSKKGCKKCGYRTSLKEKPIRLSLLDNFLINANKIHSNKYDYSKFLVNNAKTKGIIICPTHGEFLMNINNHISGKQKCKKCIEKKSCYYNIENAVKYEQEWSNTPAILYVVLLTNGVDNWLKIGVSRRKLSNRMAEIPLNYKEIFIKNTNFYKAIILENYLIKKFNKNKKIPKIKFGGMYECFSERIKLEIIDLLSFLKDDEINIELLNNNSIL